MAMKSSVFLFIFFILVGCVSNPSATALPRITPQVTFERSPEPTPDAASSPVVSQGCARGDSMDKIQSGGQDREFLLHVPPAYQPEVPAALVLVFHGAGIGAERFVDYTRFSRVADQEGFLIVYPQGLGEEPVWNPSPGSRDVQFISDLIDHLERRCNVDPDHIFASGHSNGGGMVNRLACELGDRIAAIAPISGAYSSSGRCTPSRPVPVFSIHGADDPIVPYDGISEWAFAWAQRNGCDPVPVEVVRNVLITEQRWSNCRAGADVVLSTMQGIGHTWPSDLIDVGQTIWDFFEAHPLHGEVTPKE